jgi:hypothetical protein
MIASHVMDLEQTLVLGAARSVLGAAEAEVCDSDVVVVAASVHLRLIGERRKKIRRPNYIRETQRRQT